VKDFPRPVPGLVIRYSFLWRHEKEEGHIEGLKDRPCAIVLTMKNERVKETVCVLPITHSTPHDSSLALEIPSQTKERLGLDGARSWVVLAETNVFTWPGPDLRPAVSGLPESIVYGRLPNKFFRRLRDRYAQILRARQARLTDRD
jgi:hypothetical protein